MHMIDLGDFIVDGIEDILSEVGGSVVVEAPWGIWRLAVKVAELLRGMGIEAIVGARPTWGACDIGRPPRGFNLIQLGHYLPPNIEYIIRLNGGWVRSRGVVKVVEFDGFKAFIVPTYYKPSGEGIERIHRMLKALRLNKPVITYPMLYRLYAEELARLMGTSVKGPFTGCFMPIKADEIIVVAGGYFYALTAKLMNPDSRVISVDPHRQAVESIDNVYRKYLALKVRAINEFSGAKRVAVLVSSKVGQGNLRRGLEVAEALTNMGKEAYLAYCDEAGPDLINSMDADAVIIDACPRIGLDDLDRLTKPTLTVWELKLTNGKLTSYRPSLSVIPPI